MKRNGILGRSMVKAAILVSEDKELASQQVGVCKAAGMACWKECWARKMATHGQH